jgi:hypothetical protein
MKHRKQTNITWPSAHHCTHALNLNHLLLINTKQTELVRGFCRWDDDQTPTSSAPPARDAYAASASTDTSDCRRRAESPTPTTHRSIPIGARKRALEMHEITKRGTGEGDRPTCSLLNRSAIPSAAASHQPPTTTATATHRREEVGAAVGEDRSPLESSRALQHARARTAIGDRSVQHICTVSPKATGARARAAAT